MEKYKYLFGDSKKSKMKNYNKFYIITLVLLLINYIFWFWQFNFCTIDTHMISSLILAIPIVLILLIYIITQKEKLKNSIGLGFSIALIIICLILNFFILILFTFTLVIVLIVKPLHLYINFIKEETRLDITGSYEFKYLALTYNDIYEVKASNEALLRHRAEHDPLTGLINRGAFDQIKQFFKINPCPLALLIIDVDKFKLINDNFGHETGDHILKKVATAIKESFRAKDYPARIGGDEFAVIVTEVTEEMQSTILNKAKALNEVLKNPSDGLPPVSLSIGGAFSQNGFSDDLYAKADRALYVVKEAGRCGCRFYDETLGQDADTGNHIFTA